MPPLRLLYSLLLYLLAPFILLRLAWLGRREPAYLRGWGRRLGLSVPDTGTAPVLWVHAVSVGEVQAAAPLVERLARDYPRYTILVTTMTPTGAAMVRQHFSERVQHSYLPYDFPHAVRRFVTAVRPVLLLVMETEIWPNLLHCCDALDIRVTLVNARLSPRSYRGYRRLSCFSRGVIALISHIGAQSQADGQRFISLGARPDRVTVTGNLKFDVSIPAGIMAAAADLRRQLGGARPVWIAASTHEGEEQLLLNAHREIRQYYPDCLLILAPRHPQRCAAVVELCSARGFSLARRSQAADSPADMAVFILDTLGELMVYYAAADLAFVGGSLLPGCGGHNVLEPAALGVPVISGRHVSNFSDINAMLCDSGAELQVDGPRQLVDGICMLLAQPERRHCMGQAGVRVVQANRGSTERTLQLIADAIPA